MAPLVPGFNLRRIHAYLIFRVSNCLTIRVPWGLFWKYRLLVPYSLKTGKLVGESDLRRCFIWLEFWKNKLNLYALRSKYFYLCWFWYYLFLTPYKGILDLERMLYTIQPWAPPILDWVPSRVQTFLPGPQWENQMQNFHEIFKATSHLIWLVLPTHLIICVTDEGTRPFKGPLLVSSSFPHCAVAREWGRFQSGLCLASLQGVCISMEMISKASFNKVMTSAHSWPRSLSLESWELIFIVNSNWDMAFFHSFWV